ncbi:MAG: YcaO-like family protein [Desulfovibrio sp.]
MKYELKLMDTSSGIGHFSAHPPNLSFSEMMKYTAEHQYDSYLHQFLLHKLSETRPRKLEKVIKEIVTQLPERAAEAALLYEACTVHTRLNYLLNYFEGLDENNELTNQNPTIELRSRKQEDQELHRQWIRLFSDNILYNEPIPSPDEVDLEAPVAEADLPDFSQTITVEQAKAEIQDSLPAPCPRRPAAETIAKAKEKLEAKDVLIGGEMQHKASLSPISRLRHWKVNTRTKVGGLSNSLTGIQTSYGRGLQEEVATVSCIMEVVERTSSYASFSNKEVLQLKKHNPLRYGSMEELSADFEMLDLEKLRLEVPYAGQKLFWMEGTIADNGEERKVLVPPQFIYLFANLDEPQLFSALGSTGLASGNTMDEAKVSGLCEVFERDLAAVTPFDLSKCFTIESDEPQVALLLEEYKKHDMHVWFMDLTGELGVPCYKAFIVGSRGDITQATGCGLSGKRAALSAMTEAPYPFPGPPSSKAPEGLPVRKLEDLPDYSTGSATGDRMLIENVLNKNGYKPVYVDMTRKDLDFPVMRAIIPGMEIVADFDHYSRVSPRLFANYLNMFK